MLRDQYLHPNGQLPAYEWNFGDVNPPVHAWATIFTYRLEKARRGERRPRLARERLFHKLLLNFTWWVNRKDRAGSNLFEGGFLGLDNIGVFDRSAPLPTGGYLEQADGTAWMALFCQNMLEIAAELALQRPAYAEMAAKFVEHFLWIATSMMHAGDGTGMWDEEDGFFYDVLRLPDGTGERLKVRSMVGLLPLCAVTVVRAASCSRQYPEIADRLRGSSRPARSCASSSTTRSRAAWPAAGWRRSSTSPSSGACSPDARRGGVPEPARDPLAVALPRGPPVRRSTSTAAGVPASATCRPSPTRACSAATRTGAARSGCRSTR